MQLIKDKKVSQNDWQHIDNSQDIPDGNITVTIDHWKSNQNAFKGRQGKIGLRLSSEDKTEDFEALLNHFQLIALDFPAFTDGRLFSTARILRDQLKYQGELRATGHFIRDQIFFLSRVGINSFELAESEDTDSALAALTEFTAKYQ